MFESIGRRITTTVGNVFRDVSDAARKHAWLAPVAILALFLVV
jgi:hypothetical protein